MNPLLIRANSRPFVLGLICVIRRILNRILKDLRCSSRILLSGLQYPGDAVKKVSLQSIVDSVEIVV
jgi:hypothetical protein